MEASVSKIRIVVADDHPVIRRGVCGILSEKECFEVVAEASNALEVLAAVKEHKPDLLLLDVTMPDRTGLEVLKDLKILYPRLKVLILSIHPEDRYALRALKAGAAGYLTKDSAPEELVGAIERVLKGGRYVSQSIAEKLTDVAQGNLEGIALHELLSDREFEVLRLLGEGKSVSQIADELALSVKTVSTYRARICEKLRLESTADLIRYAVEYKIVD